MAKWDAGRQRMVTEHKKWDAAVNELKVIAGKVGPERKLEYKKLIEKLQVVRRGKPVRMGRFRRGRFDRSQKDF